MARLPSVGEVIDDVFRVEAEIDSGNFGSVYKVYDLLEDRVLALKVLRPGPHDENELRQRFEREARLIYSLQHKHIVRVYYYGETTNGLPYMAMEYLEGTDLRTLLHHTGPLKPALVRRIARETLAALDAAHSLGIIHRDLKPANIFLVKDGGKGHAKVLDFGFAKSFEGNNPGQEITNAGTLVGTPAYMAPELVHKKRVGPAADLYALGLIMAEMLNGDRIIEIETVYDTILFQASPANVKLPQRVQESELYPTIRKATEKGLDRRYGTAREMADTLGGLPEVAPTAEALAHQEPVRRDLSIDEDVTIPRTMGLPSERELARMMERGGSDTQERTIERRPDYVPLLQQAPRRIHGSRDENGLSPIAPMRSDPEADTPVATPAPQAAPPRASNGSTANRSAEIPRSTPHSSPTTGDRLQVQRPDHAPRSIGQVEIEDLSHERPRHTDPASSGFSEVVIGVLLGAALLALLVLALWLNGTVQLN